MKIDHEQAEVLKDIQPSKSGVYMLQKTVLSYFPKLVGFSYILYTIVPMPKFIISTDSCADLFKSYLRENGVHCTLLERITNGVTTRELYDNFLEYEKFYKGLRSGSLPTTSQLSEFEIGEYFQTILDTVPTGDIIHVALSSGLSSTCENARRAAEKLNEKLPDRKIYIFDSLGASLTMGQIVKRLISLRDKDVATTEAIKIAEDIRDHQQVWIYQNSLLHLRRG
jgi:DegV family protein with EDD domain